MLMHKLHRLIHKVLYKNALFPSYTNCFVSFVRHLPLASELKHIYISQNTFLIRRRVFLKSCSGRFLKKSTEKLLQMESDFDKSEGYKTQIYRFTKKYVSIVLYL